MSFLSIHSILISFLYSNSKVCKVNTILILLFLFVFLSSEIVAQPQNISPPPARNSEAAGEPLPTPAEIVTFEAVKEKARAMAGSSFDEKYNLVDPIMKSLKFDEWRKIRYDSSNNILEAGSLFQIELFHVGFLFDRTVDINLVDDKNVSSSILFDPKFFIYERFTDMGKMDQVKSKGGIAGFKVKYFINNSEIQDEVAVFLGGSYFRLVSANQQFGSSARCLAIDTASSHGEEFPYFREFWIKRPAKDQKTLEIYALIDSKRITGAYHFIINPGQETKILTKVSNFPRANIEKVEIAPLTSMFLFGENSRDVTNDYRNEVHDADGLMIHNGKNEWIWRPLGNPWPINVRTTRYLDVDVQGFGIMQRDKEFRNYLDLETRYELRPSLWIEPQGSWGSGFIELVEIPTMEETVDNMVAYWVSDKSLPPKEEASLAYTIYAKHGTEGLHPFGYVKRLRVGDYHEPGALLDKTSEIRQFVVDFTGGILPEILSAEEIEGVVDASSGVVSAINVQLNKPDKGIRLWFSLAPAADHTDIRAYLRKGKEQITETLLYLYSEKKDQ